MIKIAIVLIILIVLMIVILFVSKTIAARFMMSHEGLVSHIVLVERLWTTPRERSIVFMTTHEGLISHIVQLGRLWGRASSIGRGVEIVNFQSHHYPDIDRVNICNLFTFPSSVTCSNKTLDEVVKSHNCILIQKKESWSSHALNYRLPLNVTRDPNFNFTDVDCIAGYYHGEGILPKGNQTAVFPKLSNIKIDKKYYDLFALWN